MPRREMESVIVVFRIGIWTGYDEAHGLAAAVVEDTLTRNMVRLVKIEKCICMRPISRSSG